jgi:hypothetical protein
MSKLTCMYYEKAMPVAFCNYVMNSIDWGAAQDATVFTHPNGGPRSPTGTPSGAASSPKT